MSRTTELPYRHCRFCGTRFRKEEVSKHELECLRESEEKLFKKSSPYPGEKAENAIRNKANRPMQEDKASCSHSSPPPSTSEETPVRTKPSQDPEKDKGVLQEAAYPKVSAEMLREAEDSGKEPLPSQDSLPANALVKNDPKQAWNANATRRMSGKIDDPFPPARKYRHYPISCEFCNKKFQPGPLRKHIQKYHPEEHMPPAMRGRGIGRIRPPDPREETKKKRPASGPPRDMKICYICGQMFGSKSIHIHEPKCLEKWKIQNEKLPKSKRMPEPVKPQAIPASTEGESLSGSKKGPQQKLPELDAEAEAAYRCHLKNLVPCTHCGRTFNPDRIMVHENACIERPRKRKGKGRK